MLDTSGLEIKLYYERPVMMLGNGTPYTDIHIDKYAWKQIDYYKQFHCLNCEKLPKCRLRKNWPMVEPEARFYTCSLFQAKKPIEKPKIIPSDLPTRERLQELAWALEVAMQK